MKKETGVSSVVSTLFVASLLALGLATSSTSAHENPQNPCTGHHKNDEGCGGDVGGSDGDATYSAEFFAPISGDSQGDMWNGGPKGVGANTNSGLANTRIDLKFFNDMDGSGNCFPDIMDGNPDGMEHFYKPTQVSVEAAKRGTTRAWFWFTARTINSVQASYLLKTSGKFGDLPSGWPPTDPNADPAEILLESWTLGLENGQPDLETDACNGGGSFGADWKIEISLNP